MSLLECQGLSIELNGRRLIDKLDLQIKPGESWAVLGPNGAGKSSLLRALAGLQQAQQGQIKLAGEPLQALPPKQRARQLGLVFQHSERGFRQSVLEMVLGGAYARSHWGWEQPGDLQLAETALAQVGLGALRDAPLQQLSGGELRRAEIARLLLQNPQLAMLDEPLNHLDVGQQVGMLRLLQRFSGDGHALLLVLHDINLARHAASHLLLIYGNGRWQAGPRDALDNAETLSELFGYPLIDLHAGNTRLTEIDFAAAGLQSGSAMMASED